MSSIQTDNVLGMYLIYINNRCHNPLYPGITRVVGEHMCFQRILIKHLHQTWQTWSMCTEGTGSIIDSDLACDRHKWLAFFVLISIVWTHWLFCRLTYYDTCNCTAWLKFAENIYVLLQPLFWNFQWGHSRSSKKSSLVWNKFVWFISSVDYTNTWLYLGSFVTQRVVNSVLLFRWTKLSENVLCSRYLLN